MKTYLLKTSRKQLLADTITPVSIYLRLRDKFPNSLLLESSDYHGNENSYSYICCQPIAFVRVMDGIVTELFPDGMKQSKSVLEYGSIPIGIDAFMKRFNVVDMTENICFINNGLFGYTAYDGVQHFEDIDFKEDTENSQKIPEVLYNVYRYVIVVDHFKNELYVFEHQYIQNGKEEKSEIDQVLYLIRNKDFPTYKFHSVGKETSNFTDVEFLERLGKVKKHIHRGDIFQLVLSRRFSQKFMGDEFNVYRALRSINPSPYLFYFDYGSFKIFGSSPEAQLIIRDKKASIYPIAGTFLRTGNIETDITLADKLLSDPKENAEHVMLVDLARNDLSRNGSGVEVETFREIQYYSHLIHLVSKVSAKLHDESITMKIAADTFPAGTLSGAPKHKAMELIDQYEKGRRGFYGGSIGFIGFNGDFNHAIIIRSLLSKDNMLFYQAGAGVVESSLIENELQEVGNKLLALKKAIEMAEKI